MIPTMASGHIYKFRDSETKSETGKGDNTKKENVLLDWQQSSCVVF